MVERRADTENIPLAPMAVEAKATGVAYSMRSALDYVISTPRDPLNKRVLGLYYGTMALAQAEMLAAPSGPIDLDKVEALTRNGHGLYTLPAPNGGFADLHIGVLASGFFPQWMKFLGHDASGYPKKRPRSAADLDNVLASMVFAPRPVRIHARDRRPLRGGLRRTTPMDLSRSRPSGQRAEASAEGDQHLRVVSRFIGEDFRR